MLEYVEYGPWLLKIENGEEEFEKYIEIEDYEVWRVLETFCNGFLSWLQYGYGLIRVKTKENSLNIIITDNTILILDQDHDENMSVTDTNVIKFKNMNIEELIITFMKNINNHWEIIKEICFRNYTFEEDKEFKFEETGYKPDQIIKEKLFLIKSILEKTKFYKLNEHTMSQIYQEFCEKFLRRNRCSYDYDDYFR